MPLSSEQVLISGIAFVASWIVWEAIYNVFFHPLRNFPGPLSHRLSRLPYSIKVVRGTLPRDMLRLYETYGGVVRVAPNELAFNEASAWKDIMGHKVGSASEMGKWLPFYRPMEGAPSDIVTADRDEHGQLRRTLAHGFSDRSMRDQQPLIKKYVDLLIQRLHENCRNGPINIMNWYIFTAFDSIGDLAFGEPFDCLANSESHPWVKLLFGMAKSATVLQSMAHYPMFRKFLISMIPKSKMKIFDEHNEQMQAKLARRMDGEKERPDLIEGLVRKPEAWNHDMGKLRQNAGLLVLAGSETTSTLLAGVTYLLLVNAKPLAKLTEEVRSTFSSEDEIDIISVSKLTYMLACLDEALRVYPPVAMGLPRVTPPGGGVISGHYVPGNNIVAIHHWATYHSSSNFTKPFEYHPERFLGDPAFKDDQREVLQPFHYGPRNCIGKNLAYAEMRLILARVIYNFDIRIADQSRGWMENQKVFNFWERGPLMVHLTPVKSV